MTPFSADGAVDEPALARIVDYLVDVARSDAISLPQHVGESLNMTDAERRRVVEVAAERLAGRVPLIAHVSATSTEMTVALARHAQDAGAAAVISTVPYHWRPGPAATLAHFQALCDSVEIDVLAYNFPARLGVTLTPDLLAGLRSRCQNFAGMKDASYDMQYFTQVTQLDIDVFTGIEYVLPSVALGGAGSFSPLCTVAPALVRELWELCHCGDFASALPVQRRVAALLRVVGSHGLAAGVKAAMELLERPAGPARLPILPLPDPERAQLAELLAGEERGWPS